MANESTLVEAPPRPIAPPQRRGRRWPLRLLGLSAFLAIAWQPWHIFVGTNLHAVIDGKVYRSAQLSAENIKSVVERHGIRTIVNLRGTCAAMDWYLEEAQTAQTLGLSLEDVNFSAYRWPSYTELRQLVEVLERSTYPLLLHCRQGADRTGLASLIAAVLLADAPYHEARRQLSMRYGHAPIGRPIILDRFFDGYEAWLQLQGKIHHRAAFRHWLLEVYRGGPCEGVIEQVARLQTTPRVDEPLSWSVRVRNNSSTTWQFKPLVGAGVHVAFMIWDDQGQRIATGRAGMLEKAVPPGESLTVTLVVPPLPEPGRYRLFIDLADESCCWFYQIGSEPYEEDVDVHN